MRHRSSTVPYSLLVVDSSCGHNWCLCCRQMEDVVDRLFRFFAVAECRVHDAKLLQVQAGPSVLFAIRGRYHGGRRPSSDGSFHGPTVIPPSALDKPSIMKRYHRRRTCSHTSPRRSPTMVTLHDSRFVECQ